MVRRGSTVRVRQRALESPCKSAPSLSRAFAGSPVCGACGALYGALRFTPSRCRRRKSTDSPEAGEGALGPTQPLSSRGEEGRTSVSNLCRTEGRGEVERVRSHLTDRSQKPSTAWTLRSRVRCLQSRSHEVLAGPRQPLHRASGADPVGSQCPSPPSEAM